MANYNFAKSERRNAAIETWRGLFGLRRRGFEAATESTSAGASEKPEDRIQQAREAMIRLAKDHFGGDRALID